jgi:hypothetical protein
MGRSSRLENSLPLVWLTSGGEKIKIEETKIECQWCQMAIIQLSMFDRFHGGNMELLFCYNNISALVNFVS